MNIERLEILTNLGASIEALAYFVFMIRHEDRQPIHSRLGLLLLLVALGLGGRAFYELGFGAWFNHLQYFGLGVFPVAGALFVESAISDHFHRSVKILLLLATAFFAFGSFTAWVEFPPWRLAMLSYQVAFMGYCSYRFFDSAKQAQRGPRRSYLVAMATVCIVASALIISDNRDILALTMPRMGAMSIILVIWVAAHSFHGVTRLSLTYVLGRIGLVTTFCVAFAATLAFVDHSVDPTMLAQTAVVVVLLYLMLAPLRLAWQQRHSHRVRPMLGRLASINCSSLTACMNSLKSWPEIKRVVFVAQDQLTADGYRHLSRYFLEYPGLASLENVRFNTTNATQSQILNACEEVLDLMQRQSFHFAVAIDGGVVGIQTEGILDTNIYRHVLQPIGAMFELLGQKESHP